MPFVPKIDKLNGGTVSMADARAEAAKLGYKNQEEYMRAMEEEDTIERPSAFTSETPRSLAIATYAKKHGMDTDAAAAVFQRVAATGDGTFVGGDAEDRMLYSHYGANKKPGPYQNHGSYDTKVPRPNGNGGILGTVDATADDVKRLGMTDKPKRATE